MCQFISMSGKSPTKLKLTSRHDHTCLLESKASNQTNSSFLGRISVLIVPVPKAGNCDRFTGSPQQLLVVHVNNLTIHVDGTISHP